MIKPTDGLLPPQALELEQAVLGALLLENTAMVSVANMLKPESFYNDKHKEIYRVVYNLFKEKEPIDILTVTQSLRKAGTLEGIGGAYYITSLTNRIASSANIEYHASIITQKYIQREVIRICGQGVKQAYKETTDVFEMLEGLKKEYDEIERFLNGNSRTKTMTEVVTETLQAIQQIREHGIVPGIQPPWKSLAIKIGSFNKGELYIIAARPSMGKTACVIQIAKHMSFVENKKILFVSLEMSDKKIVGRLLASDLQINSHRINRGDLLDHEYDQIATQANKYNDNLILDHTYESTIEAVRAKAIKLKNNGGLDGLVVDYLQLMKSAVHKSSRHREAEISEISRGLKLLSIELDIPVIALSQLSRKVEEREDKRPTLSDLRDSGAIEQDADMVMFLFRPEYYGMTEDENGQSVIGLCEINIAKGRETGTGRVILKFDPQYSLFSDYEKPSNPELL